MIKYGKNTGKTCVPFGFSLIVGMKIRFLLRTERGPTMKTTGESQPSMKRYLRRAARWLAVTAVVMICVVALGYAYVWYKFPYGSSHCCDLALHLSLRQYAEAHGGKF